MFELDTGSDPDPKLLGTYHLTEIIDNCPVCRSRPNRIVTVLGGGRSRVITCYLLHFLRNEKLNSFDISPIFHEIYLTMDMA
jgi:hypothetical protein